MSTQQPSSTPVVQADGLIYPDEELYGPESEYLNSEDPAVIQQFNRDAKAARLLVEAGIVGLSNLNNVTLRAAACVLSQLGMSSPDYCRAFIHQGGMTMGVSTSHLFWHPKFVLDNFSKASDTQKLNALLLHEVMHYIDGDSATSMTIQAGNPDLPAKIVGSLANVTYDISHDSGLSDLMGRDQDKTLTNYVDQKLLRAHVTGLEDGLRESLEKQDKCNADVLTVYDDWVARVKGNDLTKGDAAAKLVQIVRLVLEEKDPDDGGGNGLGGVGHVHVVSNPSTTTDENGNETTNPTDVPTPSQQDIEDAKEEQQVNLSKAAQMAGDTGALRITKFKVKANKTAVVWQDMLKRLVTSAYKGNKPNIRYPYPPELHRGIVLPTKRDPQASATVIFDTSGSMFHGGLKPLSKFLNEMHGALAQCINRLDIVPFDNEAYPTMTFTKSTASDLLDLDTPGGGGTAIIPAINQVNAENLLKKSQLLIIITDLYLALPPVSMLPHRTHTIVWLIRDDGDTRNADRIKADKRYGTLIWLPMGRL